MTKTTEYLACDLGAESGRLMRGSLAGGRLTLHELHRFPNVPLKDGSSLQWDIPKLRGELLTGLKKAAQLKLSFTSISCDSWGVDYFLLDAAGALLPPTFNYRDPRCEQGVRNVKACVPWEKIFAETGIQFMQLNTLYQLGAENPERLKKAQRLLLIGDGFNYLLSGVPRAEVSLASTSQLYNPVTKTWSAALLQALNVPARIFPEIVPSGTRLGPLLPEIAIETGFAYSGASALQVVASCSHDTAAAVAAIPAADENRVFLSSGTWSVMGVELPEPVITDQCRELAFTNEIGYGGAVRLLKNIVGLWIVQECRRDWTAAGTDYDYDTLTRLAADAPPLVSLINPDDARFLSAGGMLEKVAAFCRETGQPVPAKPGAVVRCVLESLALLYRRTLLQLRQLTGRQPASVHIVGGGSRNRLLNRFTCDALQIPVRTGPVEATAMGNILVQAIAAGHVPSLAAARQIVTDSSEVESLQPANAPGWLAAFERFSALVGK